jgi:hypothetical protein
MPGARCCGGAPDGCEGGGAAAVGELDSGFNGEERPGSGRLVIHSRHSPGDPSLAARASSLNGRLGVGLVTEADPCDAVP